ncbi:MAG TPA: peptidylprolyl isomerase [Syntrophorhabdales bacterium]|nr:peptidylprolyl isomerase [Syntrophorhabdales bacterium]
MKMSCKIATLMLTLAITVAAVMPCMLCAAEQKQPAATAAAQKPGVVAVVNGSDIPVDDFYREMNRLQRLLLQTGKPLTCPQITKLRTEVVEGLVRRELLYQEAKKSVKVTEAEINEEMKKLKEQYPSETDFTNALSVMKISSATLRAQVERALLIQKLIETQFASKVVVTDKEIWAYYDRNRESFRQPEQVRASQILIKTDPRWDDAKKAAARKKIEEIKQKIQQKQDFESLARTYSEDPSSAKGGDLGYIRTGQVLKPFEEALFVLKPGEVSDIVETSLGYHLIKATDRKPEMTVPFETLKDQLRMLMKQEKGQQEANAYIAKVREKAKVEIFLPSEE